MSSFPARWRLGFWTFLLAVILGASTATGALAQDSRPDNRQDSRQNAPGEFDFYVLSLSWSPSFCAEAAERGNNSRSQEIQCGGRPFYLVVHGHWPQY